MDIKHKLTIVEQSIKSISRHDDEDLAVRQAALARVAEIIASEGAEMQARIDARIAQIVDPAQ